MEAQITIQKPSGAIQLQALLPNLRTNNVLQVAMLCMVVDLSGLAAYGLAMVDFHQKKNYGYRNPWYPTLFYIRTCPEAGLRQN